METVQALTLQEAYRPIKINDGERIVEMPMMQAILRNITLTAAKGNQRAQRLLLNSVGEIESKRGRERLKLFEEFVLIKLRGEEQIALARSFGLPDPVPLPHPDHLTINPAVGSVTLRGPFTPEEKLEWDQVISLKATLRKQLTELEVERRAEPRRRSLKTQIANLRSMLAKIDAEELSFERVLLPGVF